MRKELDDAYLKLREGVRNDIETLFCENGFVMKTTDDEEISAATPTKDAKADVADTAAAKKGVFAAAVPAAPVVAAVAAPIEENADVMQGEKKEDTTRWDPKQRLRSPFQPHKVLQENSLAGQESPGPRSEYLRQLDAEMRCTAMHKGGVSLLARLDAVVTKLPKESSDASKYEDRVLEDMLSNGTRELRHHVALKLGNVMRKRKNAFEQTLERSRSRPTSAAVPAATHWSRVLARTDELYVLAAELEPVFVYAMQSEVYTLSLDYDDEKEVDDVVMGPIKDPVRAHEKAIDEYGSRFSDGELPEACLCDMLRCRIPCKTGSQVHQMVLRFIEGVVIEVEDEEELELLPEGLLAGGPLKRDNEGNVLKVLPLKKPTNPDTGDEENEKIYLEMYSLENKFADLDPTHFRLASCVLKLSFRQLSMYVEVEVHHEDIMGIALSENNRAQAHYDFFRQRLAGQVPETELDELLEEKLVFLVDATGIPVLLSLLVLIFTSGGEDLTKLPSNRIELYEIAIGLYPSAITLSISCPRPSLYAPRPSPLTPCLSPLICIPQPPTQV